MSFGVETIYIDGTPLTPTLCSYAHIDPVAAVGKRGSNYVELFRHGTVSTGEKYATEFSFILLLMINRSGGQGRANLAAVKALINRFDRLITITRVGPWGTYEGECEALQGIPAAASPPNLIRVPMVLPAGFWTGTSVTVDVRSL